MEVTVSRIEIPMPAVRLSAAPRYTLGWPLVVAVTIDNARDGSRFAGFPELGLTSGLGPFRFAFEPMGSHAAQANLAFTAEETASRPMEPGDIRRMLFDLSNLDLPLEPRGYRVSLEIVTGGQSARSDAIEIEFEPTLAAHRVEAERVRTLGGALPGTTGWGRFLTDNWNTVTLAPDLFPTAPPEFAPHAFLHRAWYGPERVGQLDASALDGIASPVWQGEIALWRLEIARAAGDMAAAGERASAIRAEWPGLADRIGAIERGRGALQRGREFYGAEQVFNTPPTSYPYRPHA